MKMEREESERRAAISWRRREQSSLLFTLSFPAVCVAVSAAVIPPELRAVILECDLLIALNLIGWFFLVRSLGASQEAAALKGAAPWRDAFLGVTFKVGALAWIVFRLAADGEKFGMPFLGTLVFYLFLLLLVSLLRAALAVCMPEQNRVDTAGL